MLKQSRQKCDQTRLGHIKGRSIFCNHKYFIRNFMWLAVGLFAYLCMCVCGSVYVCCQRIKVAFEILYLSEHIEGEDMGMRHVCETAFINRLLFPRAETAVDMII